ncbi:MAG: PAS domain S-box protein, partial [Oscillochloris sp.]|nr:PAS domain S-box protein [Oscillochloris sp.]
MSLLLVSSLAGSIYLSYHQLWQTLICFDLIATVGTVVLIVAIWQRILGYYRQQEKAASALRESEARFHAMFENHGAIMLLIDPQTGTIFDANQAAIHFYGYTKSKLCTMSINDVNILPPNQIAVERQKALNEERNYFVFSHKLANGLERTVEVHSSPISISERRVLFSVIHDITERKQTEEALRQNENLYRTLVDTLDVSLCRWLPDTTLLFTNEKYRRIFGIKNDILHQKWLDFLPESDRNHTTAFYQSIAQDPHTVSYEHPVTIENGSIYYYRWIDTPILDSEGQIVEFQSIGIDITERRQAEDLASAQRDLARISSSVTSSQAAWPLCLEVALRISDMDSGGLYLFDSEYRELKLVYHQGLSEDFVQMATSYSNDAPNVQLVLTGIASYFSVDDSSHTNLAKSEGLRTIAVIPIHYQGRILGCINASSHTLPQISAFARHALETIATEIGNIIVYLRTELSLRDSEEKYRSLIDSQESSISTIDQDGVFHYINQIGAAALGSTPHEVVGKRLHNFFSAEIAAQQMIGIHRVITSGQGNVVEVDYTITDHQRWYRTSIQPIRNAAGEVVLAMVNALDVTERKLTENALRRSQQLLHEAQSIANVGSWTADLYAGTFDITPEYARMIGWTPGTHTLDGLFELIHPDDREYMQSCWMAAMRGEPYDIEHRIIFHDEVQWLHVKAKIFFDQHGVPASALGITQDITARKHAEQQLLELNQTLEQRVRQRTAEVQDLYENAPIGYHSVDTDGNLIMVNQTQLSWLGYTREELLGHSVLDILAPASKEMFQANFPTFKQLGWVRDLEMEMCHKDGTIIPVLVSATAIYDGHGNYVTSRSTVFDNTERKKAEIALRESEEQNRLLFEESPDAVVLFEATGKVVHMNRAFELLTGYSSEQLVGHRLDHIGLIPAIQVAHLTDGIVQYLQSNRNFAALEIRINHAHGEVRDVGARVFGLNIRGTQHYLSTMRDITIEKKAEETLRMANAELARAARAKDEFLANMSHELRTPLNAILALSETLREQIRGPLNERQMESLHHIEISGYHLLALINDILDLSKVEAGRLDLQAEIVPVADVCQASLLFVKELAIKKSLRLAFHLNDQTAAMAADPKRLKQMLVNLLSNAVKFTPTKGQVSLNVIADAGAEVIRFAVQDTGIGIAHEDIAQMFLPFRQLDSSLSRQYEG